MRNLAKNELRLLLFFGGAIFLALNLFGLQLWTQHRRAAALERTSLVNAITESKASIQAADILRPATDWIVANPPLPTTPDAASTELLNAVRAAVESASLKLLEENLLPPVPWSSGSAAVLFFKISGPFSGVTPLLFALQKPGTWRSITRLVVRSDKQPPNVVVEIEIRQYYKTLDPPAPTPEPSA